MSLLKESSYKTLAKTTCYGLVITGVGLGMAYANLDDQVTKVSDLVLGKVASLIVGGGLAVGGGYSILSGNLMKGAGQLGIAGLIGIGVWLTKSGGIFAGLN